MCRPFWKLHHWSLWVAKERVSIEIQYVYGGVRIGDPYTTCQQISQERTCSRCGLLQRRRVTT